MLIRSFLMLTWLLASSLALQGAAFAGGVACAHGPAAEAAGPDRSADADPHAHHRGHTAAVPSDSMSLPVSSASTATFCDSGCDCAGHCATPCASALTASRAVAFQDWSAGHPAPAVAPTDAVSPPLTVPLRPPIFV